MPSPASPRVELTSPTRLFTRDHCWAQPRAGTIPAGAPGNPGPHPIVVMTLQTVELEGSDRFSGLYQMRTDDLGETWEEPTPVPALARSDFGDGHSVTVCDFTPAWHAASRRLLGTGHTAVYQNNEIAMVRERSTPYSFYDPLTREWTAWQTLELPCEPHFANAGAGSTQRYDLSNGDILLPIYFRVPTERQMSSTVVRCRVEGDRLRYVEHGSELTVPIKRGLYEPSVTAFGGRFYLTLRNDECGYVAVSDDGLHYGEPTPWRWDDGSELGNYNTQQHWVTRPDALFLVYTRRGAGNDHVMRHRAPLFMAQVDPATLRVIRSTEQELMPNRGARLGNFAVTGVTPDETWVTDAEWMQPRGCEAYGSDGSVWVARLHFS
ncbi:MAG TPA: exo-alpha-sialidase [Chthoniobacteraceae bacterium]|nr:exo-alpha-sialidase [Chthoniobacteraceae bacterium]